MSHEESLPGDITMFLNRSSIQELIDAKEREVSKGPMYARWKFVAMIDAELHGRKAKNRKRTT